MTEVGIIDYGSGNFQSVYNAVKFLGSEILIVRNASDLQKVRKIILPGVSAFGTSMKKLHEMGLIDSLINQINHENKLYLGICVGMQILMTKGYEFGEFDGLNLFSGTTVKFDFSNKSPQRLPHMGWNRIINYQNSKLFTGIDIEEPSFYFAHSYHIVTEGQYVNSQALYGYPFIASIERENIFGVQFHPEKSHQNGLMLLNNFINLNA